MPDYVDPDDFVPEVPEVVEPVVPVEPVRVLYVEVGGDGRPAQWASSPLSENSVEFLEGNDPTGHYYYNGEWHDMPEQGGQDWQSFIPSTGQWNGVADLDKYSKAVNAERDRRISGGMDFQGHTFQTRTEDRENIAGASTNALAAIMNGAQPGDYYWHGGAEPFRWIDLSNQTVQMDAQTMFAFGQAAAEWKQAHIFAARDIKIADPPPLDFADDSYWP